MIAKSTIKDIRESGWIKEDAIYNFGFDKYTPTYKNIDRSDVDILIGRENAILVNDFYLSY